jgi:pentapeptide MXKDX repeat protein
MKLFITAALAATLALSGSMAFAQASDAMAHDSMSKDSMSKDAMSKDDEERFDVKGRDEEGRQDEKERRNGPSGFGRDGAVICAVVCIRASKAVLRVWLIRFRLRFHLRAILPVSASA